MKASLVVNPVAGNRAYKSIDMMKSTLEKTVDLESFVTRKKGDAFTFAKDIRNTERVIVAGGDGTINEVINGLMYSDSDTLKHISLAVIPLGTANVLAKELDIPEKTEDALALSINGTAKKISLGKINGRYFFLMAGIGFDGETVFNVKNNFLRKLSGKGAYIISGIRTLLGYSPGLVRILTPEGELSGYTAVVSNVRCYGGRFQITPDASVTEPLLDVCVFRGRSRTALLRFILGVIRKKHIYYKDVVNVKTSELEVVSEGKVHVQVDGDYFGTLPVKIGIAEDALNLVW